MEQKIGDISGTEASEIVGLRKHAQDEWAEFFEEADEDIRFYLGDQWSEEDRKALQDAKRPVLSLNTMKKQIDLVTGYEKQNRTQIRIQPIEGSDQSMADVYSSVVAWIMASRGCNMAVSEAFENATKIGIGWIHPMLDYSEDPLNGDIVIKSENPFRMLIDPDFTEKDLSDAEYIIRLGWLSKNKCMALYPKSAKDIDGLQGGTTGAFTVQEPLTTTGFKTHLQVTEKWYKSYEKRKFAVDGYNVTEIDAKTEKRLRDLSQTPNFTEHLPIIIEKVVPVIKLVTLVGDEVIVYDDYSPYSLYSFPFIPVFGDYSKDYNRLVLKIQGSCRVLKDVQREKNKRRSQLLHAAGTTIISGGLYEEGAVDDPEQFQKMAGTGKWVKVRDRSKIQPAQPMPLQNGLINLEKMHDDDMIRMGLNSDLMGTLDGGSGASAPGITLQLRQRQGLIAVQNKYENLSFAKKLMGKQLIELINANFDQAKMERIFGQSIPFDVESAKSGMKFDVQVDEIMNSATYRSTNFLTMAQLLQQGFPATPQSFQVLVDLSDFPQDVKEKLGKVLMAQIQPPAPAGPPIGPGGPMPPEIPGAPGPVSEAPMNIPPELLQQMG